MREKRLAVGPLPWVLALICALGAGFLAERYWMVRSENELLRTQKDLVEVAAKTATTELEAEHLLAGRLADRARSDDAALEIAVLTPTPRGPAGAAVAVAWAPASRHGVLAAAGLPANAPAERYELWIATGNPSRIAAFTVSSSTPSQVPFDLPESFPTGTKLAIRSAKSGAADVIPGTADWLLVSRQTGPETR